MKNEPLFVVWGGNDAKKETSEDTKNLCTDIPEEF